MLQTPSKSRNASPSKPPLVDTPVHRASRRLQGASPEFGLLQDTRARTGAPQTQQQGMATPVINFQNPRNPKSFHGELFEDAEDWLDQFERVAAFNQWDDAAKSRHVYFSLENGARTWFENNERRLKTWTEFRSEFLQAHGNSDRRENAERELQSRVQLPNESVTMYAEDMERLFRRADPAMAEEKKVRHLMRGVKEQLFGGLVRSPPKTVREFITEATMIERTLRQRASLYERQANFASHSGGFGNALENPDALRELIRSIVSEELQKLRDIRQPSIGSIASVVRDEVQHALRAPPVHADPPVMVPDPLHMSYADALRRPATAAAPLVYPGPIIPVQSVHSAAAPSVYSVPGPRMPLQSAQSAAYVGDRRRKTDVWRTPDLQPLCYHCGEAGHLYRECRYRRLGLRGFAIDSPRPRPGQRPQAIAEYIAQQRPVLSPQRHQSRSPSPRRVSPRRSSYTSAPRGRSPSPVQEN